MIRAREILAKIQEISRHYLSGRPPIALSGLTEELRTSKEEILPALRELEQRELISFYSLAEAIKLTAKGSGLILKDNNSKAP